VARLGERPVLRLTEAPDEAELAALNEKLLPLPAKAGVA